MSNDQAEAILKQTVAEQMEVIKTILSYVYWGFPLTLTDLLDVMEEDGISTEAIKAGVVRLAEHGCVKLTLLHVLPGEDGVAMTVAEPRIMDAARLIMFHEKTKIKQDNT